MVKRLLCWFIIIFTGLNFCVLAFAATDSQLLRQGQEYFDSQKYEKAAAAFQVLIEKYPDSEYMPYAFYGQGLSYLKSGEYKKAKGRFREVLSEYVDEKKIAVDSMLGLAECYRKLGEYNLAISTYDKIYRKYPGKRAEVNMGKAWTFYTKGDMPSAERCFQKLIKSSSNLKSLEKIYILGTMYKEQNDHKKAIEVFKKIPKDSVLIDDTYYQMGDIALKVKNHEKAIEFLRGVKSQTSYFNKKVNLLEMARYRMAATYYSQDKFYEARIICEDFLKKFPASRLKSDIQEISVLTYVEQEKIKELLGSYAKLADIDAQEKEGLKIEKTIAGYFYSKGDYKRAAEFYEKQVDIGKGVFEEENLFNLGNSYFYLNNFSKAIEAYKVFLEKFPNSPQMPQAAFRLGYAFSAKGDYEASLKLYKIVESSFKDADYMDLVVYNIGWCYFKLDESSEALKYYEKFVNAFPQSKMLPIVLFEIGNVYYGDSRFSRAIEYYRQVVDKFAGEEIAPAALYRLGRSYAYSGDTESANKQWKRLSRDYQGTEMAKKASLELIESSFNNKEHQNAFGTGRNFLNAYPDDLLAGRVIKQMLDFYLENKEYDEGLEFFNCLTKDYKGKTLLLVELYASLGELYLAKKLNKQALESAKKIFLLTDNFSKAVPSESSIYAIGSILLTADSQREAMNFYELIGSKAENEEMLKACLLGKGEIYLKSKDYRQAGEFFKKLINQYPRSEFTVEANMGLADSLYYRDMFDEAEEIYNSVITNYRDKGTVEAYYRLGQIYFDKGKCKEALACYQHIIVFCSDKKEWAAESLLMAGRCQEELGVHDKAASLYKKLISNYPDTEEAETANQKLKGLNIKQ
ncbi:MAG: tetratricopeptide repeat protein [Candidatus Omnitrophica bacterium]|nr:tetratricopeptide repeat protein [Candidatus Omnitrophota bacterium]